MSPVTAEGSSQETETNSDYSRVKAYHNILPVLRSGESSGYEIMKHVRQASGKTLELSSALFPPVLHLSKKNEWIRSQTKKMGN